MAGTGIIDGDYVDDDRDGGPADRSSRIGARAERRRFLDAARRAVLATTDPEGRPRLVPICYAIEPHDAFRTMDVIWTPLDDKPKATNEVLALARVREAG